MEHRARPCRFAGRLIALALTALAIGCGGAPTPAAPSFDGTVFDATLVGTTPASGSSLTFTPPNDNPVDLSATFAVHVPRGFGGTYLWNTAVQAEQPLGFTILPIASTAFREIALRDGDQNVTITGFLTTNAVCIQPERTAASTTTLDIDVRPLSSGVGQRGAQILGKRFPATFRIQCRSR